MSDIKSEGKNDNNVDDVSKNQLKEDRPTPTKNKRSATKRLSTLERTAQESEAFMKGMNTSVGDIEGRRRTRSSARGLTPSKPVPSPPKKPKHDASVKPSGRGRGRPKRQEKLSDNNTDEDIANNKTEKNVDKEAGKMDVDEHVKEEYEEEEDEDEDDEEDDETEEEDKSTVATEKKKKCEKNTKESSDTRECIGDDITGNKGTKGHKENKENRENKDSRPITMENTSATNSTQEEVSNEQSAKLVVETQNQLTSDEKKNEKDDAENDEDVKESSDLNQTATNASIVQNSINVIVTESSNQISKTTVDEKKE